MQPLHPRRRLSVVTIATVASLVCPLIAGPVARADTAPDPLTEHLAGFHELHMPATLDMGNLPRHADADREVSAIVQLAGESTLAAVDEATAANQRVDRTEIERQVLDAQQVIASPLQDAGATIEGNITTVLNAVRVRVKVKDLPAVAAVPGVVSVHVARNFKPDNGRSDAYTGVDSAWQDLGIAGDGMTIAIIDDGIDYYHADFGGVDGAAKYQADDGSAVEPGTFPTPKVVAGFDFVGDDYDSEADQPGETTLPSPDPDPLACGDHGTHVAGTAAGAGVLADGSTYQGPYDATTLANDFLVAPGSAPQASIESYKVFGCDGSTDDAVLLAAIDAAVASGADVVNLSLGTAIGSADDPVALAVDAASKAGVVMVVAAGNEGTGAYVVGGPSTANSAISVAAVDAIAMIPGASVTGAVTTIAQNSNEYDFVAAITGELVDVGLGCSADDFAAAAGKIAITTRGECDRVARAVLGTAAGAVGVIFVNDAQGLPPLEGPIPDASVPFLGVTPQDGALFQAAVGQLVTLDAGPAIANPTYQYPASFTSSGPRNGDSALKPDISAPGVSVLSASAGTGTGAQLLSGTSMASPHTAGIAALVRQAHPGWDAAAIKAAMMSTAAPEGIVGYSARRSGAGLVEPRSAVDTVAFISTDDGLDNLSFGFEEVTNGLDTTRTFRIYNTSDKEITYDLASAIDDAATGASVTIEPSTVTVPAGEHRKITVELTITQTSLIPSADSSDAGQLAAIDGYIVAQPREQGVGIHRLVTPLLMVPGGISNVRATPVRNWHHHSKLPPLPYRIKLYNNGQHAGNANFFQWAITDHIGDSGDPQVPDIRDVGVQSFPLDETGPLVVFAINTAERRSTQSLHEYDIAIDSTGDGDPDFVLVGADAGVLTTGIPDGTFASALFAIDGTPLALFGSAAPANGSTVELAMPAGAIGNPALFSFTVLSASVIPGVLDVDETRTGWFAPDKPAVHAINPFEPDVNFPYLTMEPLQYVPVQVSADRRAAHVQHALGWLIVTTDDAAGELEADRVPLRP